MKIPKMLKTLAALACLTPLLSACISDGDISNPIERRFTYFSHINGDDLRATCRPGANDHLRLTFNGRYDDQVRFYDLTPEAGRWTLREQVFTDLVVNQGLTLSSLGDVFTGMDRTVPLNDSSATALWSAVTQAGALTPATPGMKLDSDHLWWVAVGCRGEQVFFHAWQQNETIGVPGFYQTVQEYDAFRLAWPPLKAPPTAFLNSPRDRTERTQFVLETKTDGLIY